MILTLSIVKGTVTIAAIPSIKEDLITSAFTQFLIWLNRLALKFLEYLTYLNPILARLEVPEAI